MQHRWLTFVVLPLIAIVLTLPVLAVLGSWLQWDAQTAQILREMGQTVLPDYALTTLALCTMVAVGTTLDNGYVVESISDDTIMLTYPKLGTKVAIPVGADRNMH